MWLGRKALDEEFKCGRTTLEMSDELKYLGVIQTRNLKCDRHLAYLEQKNDKQIRLINAVNALTGGLTLNKMVIYKQAYLTAILY